MKEMLPAEAKKAKKYRKAAGVEKADEGGVHPSKVH
jgi:hypothetical protein